MGTLGKLVTHSKKNVRMLVQIYFRSIELNNAQEIIISRTKSKEKIISRNGVIQKIVYNSFTISLESRDAFFKLKDGKFVKVVKIVGSDWSDISLTCLRLFDISVEPRMIKLKKWKLNDYIDSYFSVELSELDQKCAVMPHDAPSEDGSHKFFTCMPFTGHLNEIL